MRQAPLDKSIEALIQFLALTGDTYWILELKDVRRRLGTPGQTFRAKRDLKAMFGAMGSLNDFAVHPDNHNVPEGYTATEANAEFGRLADAVYRNLHRTDLIAKVLWWWRPRKRSQLPPRISSAFGR